MGMHARESACLCFWIRLGLGLHTNACRYRHYLKPHVRIFIFALLLLPLFFSFCLRHFEYGVWAISCFASHCTRPYRRSHTS